ncbi:MAG: flagellar protein FlgN [Lachnospiraceae bacterium]|nr:flagellar protein FlgN [Lachnospiraceae bacterium]
MASLIEELITTLKEETVEYEALLGLSTEKTGIIVRDDIQNLNEMVAKEQSHLDRIANLEKKRTEVMKDIAIVLNKDVNTLTVKGISELLEGQKKEQQELSQTRDKLKKLLTGVEAVNEMNKGLIEEALEMINFNINYINGLSQLPETANYTRDAYNQNQMGLSTFDAKN